MKKNVLTWKQKCHDLNLAWIKNNYGEPIVAYWILLVSQVYLMENDCKSFEKDCLFSLYKWLKHESKRHYSQWTLALHYLVLFRLQRSHWKLSRLFSVGQYSVCSATVQHGAAPGQHSCKCIFLCISDRFWLKQAFGLKISYVNFSLELINNNFWLKCWNNYYSIFMGSRDMNFITLFYSEVQFREKRLQSLLI